VKEEFDFESKIEKEWSSHGYLCRVVLNQMGNRCAYIRIPKTHPFFGAGYTTKVSIDLNRAKLKELETGNPEAIHDMEFGGILAMLFGDRDAVENWLRTPNGLVKVHGGITYATDHFPLDKSGEKNDEWWMGWDAGHAGDYIPFAMNVLKIRSKVALEMGDTKKASKFRAYIARVDMKEQERDFAYEARIHAVAGHAEHYWTLEDMVEENERFAEQLSVIELLGLSKEDSKNKR